MYVRHHKRITIKLMVKKHVKKNSNVRCTRPSAPIDIFIKSSIPTYLPTYLPTQ